MARLQDVLIIGPRAAQPLATTVSAGTVYSVSDEGNIQEQSDGTSWIPYGGSGGGGGGSGLTQLTGDVAAGPGSGSQVATIQPTVVTNAKLATMAQATLKGRAAGVGTGVPVDLTATQATAILNSVVGDAGAGGTKGLVPAPAAGDAAAGKFLKADGTFQVPTAAGGGITQLVGDVAAGPGSGLQGATIQPDVVTNTQLANMAASTLKGRAAGVGTGDPTDLTATQATAILDPFIGDSGAGGIKGIVPGPAAGDAAAGKVLGATGGWVVPTASGGSNPIGTMLMWPGAVAPTNHLMCDGALYSKTTFAALYAALGGASSPWGQNSTQFNVPDMRNRMPIGANFFGLGVVGGTLSHTHQAPAHSHAAGTLAAVSHTHAGGSLATASHTHAAGALAAASHVHGAGSLVSDGHQHTFGVSIDPAGDHNHGLVGSTDYGGAHSHTVNINSVGGADTGSGINLARPGIYTVDYGGDHTHNINLPTTTNGEHTHSGGGITQPGGGGAVGGSTAAAAPGVTGDTGAAAPAVSGATAAAAPVVTGATATDGATTTDAANQAFAAVNYIIKAA